MRIAALAFYDRARRVNHLVIDGSLALLVACHALATVSDRAPALAMALLLVETLCVMFRRRAPLVVLAVSGLAFCAYSALGFTPRLPFAPLIALYTVAAGSTAIISAAVALLLTLGVVLAAAAQAGPLDDDVLDNLGALLAGWGLGHVARLSHARATLLEEKARQLEREQAAQSRLAVEQERARIAREMHDIIAHNVSVIVAQAGATRRVFDSQPEKARQALGSIERTARDAVVQMRWLLGIWQTENDETQRTPQPGLDQLPALLAQIEKAGLPVQLVSEGTPRPLPAGIELNAFRIIQEALTNTLKHAGPTQAQVVLGYGAHALALKIRDHGRGRGLTTTAGHGLAGMRQRVALFGGEVAAGPGPRGGYEVTAKLPVNGQRVP